VGAAAATGIGIMLCAASTAVELRLSRPAAISSRAPADEGGTQRPASNSSLSTSAGPRGATTASLNSGGEAVLQSGMLWQMAIGWCRADSESEWGQVILRKPLWQIVTARAAGLGLAVGPGRKVGASVLRELGIDNQAEATGLDGDGHWQADGDREEEEEVARSARYRLEDSQSSSGSASGSGSGGRREGEDAAWWLVLVVGQDVGDVDAGADLASLHAGADDWTDVAVGADRSIDHQAGAGGVGTGGVLRSREGATVAGIASLCAWSREGAMHWSSQVRAFVLGGGPVARPM